MQAINKRIWEMAYGLEQDLTKIRRDLHQHPELGFKETRTAEKIAAFLVRLKGMTVENGIGKTGVAGMLTCARGSNQTIVLRADIDAVAMSEESDVSYKSLNKGCMHSCGHDGHVALLLGAASILSDLREQLAVNVKFIFQPAEEGALGGAKAMLRDGVLIADNISAIYGFHLNATSDFGKVGVAAGPIMAGATRFVITVKGQEGHSAYPEKSIDPLLTANNIYNALQSAQKSIHASAACVISVCSMNTISPNSNIPEKVEMRGAIRIFDRNALKIIMTRMREIVENIGKAFGAECKISFKHTYQPTCNDPFLCGRVQQASAELELPTEKIIPSMGSDDFSEYLENIPGVYMTFGIRKGENFPVAHSKNFDFDEKILPIGAAVLAKCALLNSVELPER